ncbi:MAG: hypothetical protein B7Y40_00580 [Gammaproteobacteria bacterium 28-57-27]|nr:MAG: hypothetical protein B7Y40_00580 [Gammaproteobacteria bacterium 28-57-27]
MHAQQKLQQLENRIVRLHGHREGLKRALEVGTLHPRRGFALLNGVDNELSWMDSLFKNVLSNAKPAAAPSEHPAAAWARDTVFDAAQLDCIIAIMLKILDGKCKMEDADKSALSAVYDALRAQLRHEFAQSFGLGFGEATHALIDAARHNRGENTVLAQQICEARMQAEATIPKLVMKAFKQRLQRAMPRHLPQETIRETH